MRFMAMSPNRTVALQRLATIRTIYAPLIWLGSNFEPAQEAIAWYNRCWMGPIQ